MRTGFNGVEGKARTAVRRELQGSPRESYHWEERQVEREEITVGEEKLRCLEEGMSMYMVVWYGMDGKEGREEGMAGKSGVVIEVKGRLN